MTEHLYDRNNPKSNLRYRGTGIEGLFYGVPNINERAEMIARAVAKQSDGDLTKFVMQSQKPRDVGQKWRVFKNIARFFKNPVGYMYWKSAPMHNQNRVRMIWAILLAQLYFNFVTYAAIKNQKEGAIKYFLYSIGEYSHSQDSIRVPNRFPADRHKNYIRYSNFHQKQRPKSTNFLMTPGWCRDQNFRKYFEMRKKHGIQPSDSGFYHEPIYQESQDKIRKALSARKMRDPKS